MQYAERNNAIIHIIINVIKKRHIMINEIHTQVK